MIAKCGKFERLAYPGLLIIPVPCICSRVGNVSTRLQETIVRCETKTKDNVFISMECSVQYEVLRDRIYEAFYKLQDPYVQLSAYVFDVVRAAVLLQIILSFVEFKLLTVH